MHKFIRIKKQKEIRENSIDILLSTYNGELYLKELLDSIYSQTYINWKLIIRDDGSEDSTLNIIEQYKHRYPDRIVILTDQNAHLGPAQSFGKLIEGSKAPFLALCDQDDVWLPDKLEKQMAIMLEKTNTFNSSMPILVHSDLKVCDEKLDCIFDSFWRYQNINPLKMKDNRCLLFQNFITGCTILMNRSLAQRVIPISQKAVMFDWWITLIAKQLGKIVTINEPLVKYRQHGNNAIGAKKWGMKSGFSRLLNKRKVWKTELLDTKFQAQALLDHLANEKECDFYTIIEYTKMFEKQWFLRKIHYIKIGMRKYGRFRQLITWLLI